MAADGFGIHIFWPLHHSAIETLDTNGHLWPDADEQTRIVNDALTGLRKGDSRLRVLGES
jgi:hypothetical protein